ncbi:hypothetical protein AKJ37_01940 [candidate division MSBL1 archaeon SCGC-AAA259I09]|uniref:NFACT RNA-binding domain-containing protein n=5 Tax=candidate division MSBL1 TaxID=215777 RepID=A0A133UUN2_9EURY|nr:hypothetical protein AKJ62_03495 [candidate division MSBL1 archaeon SCGC-AAA259D14]KXA89541.1 hypothetical protein AKJ61_02665 [candidate division MSBL1 archaeon SCGC-AAA259B11]KXA97912.1 hypothetical protein AKJ37_01940 [candidate division MSBL1 archaeon SCGC-AAA259I09]
MKETMSGLDIKTCIDELKTDILDSWVGKIYGINESFLIKLNTSNKNIQGLIVEPGRRIHLTFMDHPTPKQPPAYAMFLRKYLSNSKLVEINQPDLERVVEIKFEKENEYFLISELFGKGNLILCDEQREIIHPYESKVWKDREIKPGQVYSLPPKKGKNIAEISERELKELIIDAPDLVRGLARNLSIGGQIAEEICARAGLNKKTEPQKMTRKDYKRLFSTIESFLNKENSPQIIYENDTPIDVLPFSFETMRNKEAQRFKTFNRALDNYFQKVSEKEVKNVKEEKTEKKLKEFKSRLERQEKNIQKLKEKARKTKQKADLISKSHEKIDKILDKLNKIRKTEGWEKIRDELGKSKPSRENWAKLIKKIQPNQGKVELILQDFPVELDIRISSFKNASKYYEKNKQFKSKLEGAKEAKKKTKDQIQEIKEKGVKISTPRTPKKKRKKKWFERYRWFYSSQGLLVIAGRDAKTNQEIVEKHMEPNDIYFHADLEGAPHLIVKSEGERISEKTEEEAAIFAAIHSKGWRKGLGNLDVYSVKPNQVSKEAPAGEYLPKGGYIIKGEKNYQTVPLEAAVGLIEIEGNKIPMCGPPSAVQAHSKNIIKLKPGSTKKSNLASEIKSSLDKDFEGEINIDELMQILPPGPGMISS